MRVLFHKYHDSSGGNKLPSIFHLLFELDCDIYSRFAYTSVFLSLLYLTSVSILMPYGAWVFFFLKHNLKLPTFFWSMIWISLYVYSVLGCLSHLVNSLFTKQQKRKGTLFQTTGSFGP